MRIAFRISFGESREFIGIGKEDAQSEEMIKDIVKMLARRAGFDVSTPHGADRLQKEIEKQTGERLSINTVKRLTGVLRYEGSVRASTLEIIALYLGYPGVKELMGAIEGSVSGFHLPPIYTDLSKLAPGTEVEMEWPPDRLVALKHIAEGKYRVMKSLNSKLREEDILTVGLAAEGIPLLVKEVTRGSSCLGPYTAASDSGLTKLRIFEPEYGQ